MEFAYTAIAKDGKRVKSFMKAASADEVASTLRQSGSRPVKIIEIRKKASRTLVDEVFADRKRVSNKELIVFTRQLGTILGAGVLLSEALQTIAADLENEHLSQVIKTVIFHVHSGESFSHALSYHPSVFSPYYVAIVGSGEAVGRLGSTILGLAAYMEKSEAMRLKFLGAIRYPVFLMSFVVLIVSGIVLFLIPKFSSIFEGAGMQLPALTQVVVGISRFSLKYFPFILVGVILLFAAAWQAMQNFRIRFMVDYYLIRLPLVGKAIHKAFISQFCHTLSALLDGGVVINTALPLATKALGNLYLKQAIIDVGNSVLAGSSLSQGMAAQKDIPRVLVKMVAVGEKSGLLSDMLKRMGDYYDQEVDTFLNNINSILEPTMIVIIGAVVLVVALALYLPIFHMSQAVH